MFSEDQLKENYKFYGNYYPYNLALYIEIQSIKLYNKTTTTYAKCVPNSQKWKIWMEKYFLKSFRLAPLFFTIA